MDRRVISEKMYDLTYLQSMGGIQDEFVDKLMLLFLEQSPELRVDLGNAIENEDWFTTHQIAHKLKSSFTTLGIRAALNEIKLIDKWSRHEMNLEQIPSLYKHVSIIMQTVENQIQVRLKSA